MYLVVYPFFFAQQMQVLEVLVFETQLQERHPEIQVCEHYVTETQVQEIQSKMLVLQVQLRETKPRAWITKIFPGTPVQQIKPGTHCIEIQVPLTQLQEIPPETHVLVTHTKEQGAPVAHLVEEIQPISMWLERKTLSSDIFFNLIVPLSIIYSAVPIIVRQCYIKRKLRDHSKDAAVFTALVAAKDLKKGNPVKASLSIDRLLIALSHLLAKKSVDLEMSHVSPEHLMHITPHKIRKRAVFQVVQASKDTTGFQKKLRELARGLQSNADSGYLAAHEFLIWLDKETKCYHDSSQSFFEKHPTLRTATEHLGPPIIAALGGIVVLLLG